LEGKFLKRAEEGKRGVPPKIPQDPFQIQSQGRHTKPGKFRMDLVRMDTQ